jgi:SAM-dependent methyltransferase
MDHWRGWGGPYQRRLAEVYRFAVPPGLKVLELGCGTGDLLAALKPALGIGVDLSLGMLRRAKARHPELHCVQGDAQTLRLHQRFDVIILSDLVNDLWDAQTVLENLASMVHARSRVILNSYSRLWELPLALAQRLGLAKPSLQQNWFTTDDLAGLLQLTGFDPIRSWPEVLLPLGIPWLAAFANRVLVRFWPFHHMALTNFTIARPLPSKQAGAPPSVSVIVPARNEAGNIPRIFQSVPASLPGCELIFIEGHSRDSTYEVILQQTQAQPHIRARLQRQAGVGKGDAVRLGFAQATGEILAILDADLTVAAEDLPRFVAALTAGKADLVNGVRLVYPMEEEAMRYLNLMGNKLFGLGFSWLLGQKVRDTLCGTKVLWRSDYQRIAANRAHFGDFDPFGDFDLLFGAARLNLKILDLPIRYHRREYGQTNVERWRHGWLLLRMLLFAMRRLKFV